MHGLCQQKATILQLHHLFQTPWDPCGHSSSLSPCKQPRQLLGELLGTHVHLQAIYRERLTKCHTRPQSLPSPTTVVVPSRRSSPLPSTVLFIAWTAMKPPFTSPSTWRDVCVLHWHMYMYRHATSNNATNQMLYTVTVGIVSFIVWLHHTRFLEGGREMV